MQLFYSSSTAPRIEMFYSIGDGDLTSLGFLESDHTMPPSMYSRIVSLKEAHDAYRAACEGTPATHCASDIYNRRGQLKDLRIYGNSWRYSRGGSVTLKAISHKTLSADIQYFALSIAVRNDIEEGSIAFLILKSVIRNMYKSWEVRK